MQSREKLIIVSIDHVHRDPILKQIHVTPWGIPRVWKIPRAYFLLTEQFPQIVYAWFRSPWSCSLSDFRGLVTQRWFMWKQCSLFYVILGFLTNFWCEFDLTEVKCFPVSVICGMFPFSHEALYPWSKLSFTALVSNIGFFLQHLTCKIGDIHFLRRYF